MYTGQTIKELQTTTLHVHGVSLTDLYSSSLEKVVKIMFQSFLNKPGYRNEVAQKLEHNFNKHINEKISLKLWEIRDINIRSVLLTFSQA